MSAGLVVLALWASVAGASPAARTEPSALKHKLLPGADGKMCLDCHEAFQEKMRRPVLHTPVKKTTCVGCHDPHASDHGNLLSANPGQICQSCHQKLIPATAKSVHAPAGEGACGKCHDAHGAGYRNVLLKPETELCSSCHEDVVRTAQKAKVKHEPLTKTGCSACHDPHASAGSSKLLERSEPQLCLECHKSNGPEFARAHHGFPVEKAGCSACHDPHGSNSPKMLRDNVHAPVARRECAECHNTKGTSGPLALKVTGAALCTTCHQKQVAAMNAKAQVHWALASERACLSCHDPHASSGKDLIDGKMTTVCGSCHQDTLGRGERSPTKHKPVFEGKCAECHDPHASDGALLLKKSNAIELCAQCHDWQRHSSHPIGDHLKDPRNPNLTIDCLSCHRAHGTEYKHLMPTPNVSDLCTKCHSQYRR